MVYSQSRLYVCHHFLGGWPSEDMRSIATGKVAQVQRLVTGKM
jgi:hypothetical protein